MCWLARKIEHTEKVIKCCVALPRFSGVLAVSRCLSFSLTLSVCKLFLLFFHINHIFAIKKLNLTTKIKKQHIYAGRLITILLSRTKRSEIPFHKINCVDSQKRKKTTHCFSLLFSYLNLSIRVFFGANLHLQEWQRPNLKMFSNNHRIPFRPYSSIWTTR